MISYQDIDIIIDRLKQKELEIKKEEINIDVEVLKLEKKQDDLLDIKLGGNITEQIFLKKNNQLEKEIFELRRKETEVKSN